MDEGDDYVPQISQMDTTGGFPFANDLSADSYVPPPPGPPERSAMTDGGMPFGAMRQHIQQQPGPPNFYGAAHSMPGGGVVSMPQQPPPGQIAVPSSGGMTSKGKPKTKKLTKAQQAAAAAAAAASALPPQAPQSMLLPQSQQQVPHPGQSVHYQQHAPQPQQQQQWQQQSSPANSASQPQSAYGTPTRPPAYGAPEYGAVSPAYGPAGGHYPPPGGDYPTAAQQQQMMQQQQQTPQQQQQAYYTQPGGGGGYYPGGGPRPGYPGAYGPQHSQAAAGGAGGYGYPPGQYGSSYPPSYSGYSPHGQHEMTYQQRYGYPQPQQHQARPAMYPPAASHQQQQQHGYPQAPTMPDQQQQNAKGLPPEGLSSAAASASPHWPQQPPQQQAAHHMQLDEEFRTRQQQLHNLYQQPQTPQIHQQIGQLQQRLSYLQSRLSAFQQQQPQSAQQQGRVPPVPASHHYGDVAGTPGQAEHAARMQARAQPPQQQHVPQQMQPPQQPASQTPPPPAPGPSTGEQQQHHGGHVRPVENQADNHAHPQQQQQLQQQQQAQPNVSSHMSVMVPPGHRGGAAVEVNIQQPAPSHTLISVYQYHRDGAPPPRPSPDQHQSPAVPPEPVPPAPCFPNSAASSQQQQQQSSTNTPMLTRMLSPAGAAIGGGGGQQQAQGGPPISHAMTDAAFPFGTDFAPPLSSQGSVSAGITSPISEGPPPKKKGRPRKNKDAETPPKEKGKRGRKKKSDVADVSATSDTLSAALDEPPSYTSLESSSADTKTFNQSIFSGAVTNTGAAAPPPDSISSDTSANFDVISFPSVPQPPQSLTSPVKDDKKEPEECTSFFLQNLPHPPPTVATAGKLPASLSTSSSVFGTAPVRPEDTPASAVDVAPPYMLYNTAKPTATPVASAAAESQSVPSAVNDVVSGLAPPSTTITPVVVEPLSDSVHEPNQQPLVSPPKTDHDVVASSAEGAALPDDDKSANIVSPIKREDAMTALAEGVTSTALSLASAEATEQAVADSQQEETQLAAKQDVAFIPVADDAAVPSAWTSDDAAATTDVIDHLLRETTESADAERCEDVDETEENAKAPVSKSNSSKKSKSSSSSRRRSVGGAGGGSKSSSNRKRKRKSGYDSAHADDDDDEMTPTTSKNNARSAAAKKRRRAPGAAAAGATAANTSAALTEDAACASDKDGVPLELYDDGAPTEYIETRRSSRVTQRKKYTEEQWEVNLSDEDNLLPAATTTRKQRRALAAAAKLKLSQQHKASAEGDQAADAGDSLATSAPPTDDPDAPTSITANQGDETPAGGGVDQSSAAQSPDHADESIMMEDEPVAKLEDTMIVEKILLVRTRPKDSDGDGATKADKTDDGTKDDTSPKQEPALEGEEKTDKEEDEKKEQDKQEEKDEKKEQDKDEETVEEFYVKYKNFSYLHCDWKSQQELELGDRRVVQKIKRFKLKREQATTFLDEQFDEDEPFNPDYVQVERVLDVSTSVERTMTEVILQQEMVAAKLKKEGSVEPDEDEGGKASCDKVDGAESQEAEDKAKPITNEHAEGLEASGNGEQSADTAKKDATKSLDDPLKCEQTEAPPAADECAKAAAGESPEEATKCAVVAPDVGAKSPDDTAPLDPNPTINDDSGEASRQSPVVTTEDGAANASAITTTVAEGQDEGQEEDEAGVHEETVTHYLIKWRSLQYEDCTWELERDVDSDKIKQFETRAALKPTKQKEKARPHASDWVKVDTIPVFKAGNMLREYQLEGVNWLLFCWYNRRNCILADEMGLGKTIQSIAFLSKVQEYGIRGPFLIIAPLSTIHNWQREFETWTDINAVVYHGNSVSRKMIQEYEMYGRNKKGDRYKNFYKFDVLITTYEMILADVDELKEIAFRICVIDEAHRLKNRNCKLLQGLNDLKMETRVLLTGTPLQNNIDELFSLLNFLEPKQFSCSQTFLEDFGSCQTDDQVNKLQGLLKPMMLRRLKEDVEKSLKAKEETIIEVELSNVQKKYYRAILERNFSYLSKGASAPSLMNTMMELRKCCNHPFLITGAEEQIVAEHQHTTPGDEAEAIRTCLVQASGKLVLCDKLLPKLRQDRHKVLIFSQMVRCLDLLEEYLINMKYPFERIDGNVRGDLRQAAIDRFCRKDMDRFVFLLCTRAGGLGINLTAADTVIIFDSDWNPQNDLQAQARCHRIGQEKFVKVYRLITRNTYEREMFDKASMKLGLDKAVLQSMGTKENLAAQLSKKEVEELLRKGAYGAVMDETNEGDKFSEEDIDTILQRRTQTITVQAGVKGSTFAKASFNVTSNREDIDVNDPNFWQKWAKKANVDINQDPSAELILSHTRTRKRRFAEEMYRLSDDDSGGSSGDDSAAGGAADDDSEADEARGGRRHGDDTAYAPDELAFSKADYFKIEKQLSVFGWGRWREMVLRCDFKATVTESEMEHLCRTVLLHCLRQFTGDEKIRDFIWQLISPNEDVIRQGEQQDAIAGGSVAAGKAAAKQRKKARRGQKHRKSTRNRRGGASAKDEDKDADTSATATPGGGDDAGSELEKKQQLSTAIYHTGWAALPAYNPPSLAVDYAYQRHLQRHSNKVLLRIRLLYYLEHEILGKELAVRVLDGESADAVELASPPWHPELPVDWWDARADKSLLIGIFKHGFENFSAMRDDPCLCFVQRCGPSEAEVAPPSTAHDDDADAKADLGAPPATDDANLDKEEDDVTESSTPAPTPRKRRGKRQTSTTSSAAANGVVAKKEEAQAADDSAAKAGSSPLLAFPNSSELNARFRRLMNLYQKSSKLSMIREEQNKRKSARQEHIQAMLQERESRKLEERQRWSRREEQDFYRTLVSFGVEQDADTADYRWHQFKVLGRLEAKFDQTLTDYYTAFMAMCKRICRRPLTTAEETLSYIPEAMSEERANKVLQRVDFMARVRAALRHPKLEERIQLCKKTPDLPFWWEVGVPHDLDLLKGIAKHGVHKSEEAVVHDSTLSFAAVWQQIQKESSVLLHGTRATTRASNAKPAADDDDATLAAVAAAATTSKEECKKETKNAPKEKEDDEDASHEAAGTAKAEDARTDAENEAIISQILAQQSGNLLQWPKERMLIFRVQNVCLTIEQAEWPSAALPGCRIGALGGGGADFDQRSTPDDTPRDTPSMFAEESRDSPLAAAHVAPAASSALATTPSVPTPAALASSAATTPTTTPKSRRGRKPKTVLQQSSLAAAAASQQATSSAATTSATAAGATSSAGGGAAGGNPLQDLMEAEKERMRALQHQAFLHQLEQLPFATAAMAASGLPFPFSLAGLGLDGSGAQGGAMPTLDVEAKTARVDADPASEALNLSTKSVITKKSDVLEAAHSSSSSKSKQHHSKPATTPTTANDDAAKALSLSEMMAMATLPSETRIPVINLTDGSRLTGKEAPTIRNLNKWLQDNPHYIIDMPGSTVGGNDELEPGEIVRPKTSAASAAKTTDVADGGGGSASTSERITVVNRKNAGLRVSGAKAPTLRNLLIWLDKNPDWDVDAAFVDLVKSKLRIPDKLKSRLLSSKQQSASSSSGGDGASHSSSKAKASAQAAQAAAQAAVAAQQQQQQQQQHQALMAAAAGLDPFTASLLAGGAGGLDANTAAQLQMQMMMQNPMFGMGGFGFPQTSFAMPPFSLPSSTSSLFGMPSMASPVNTTAANSSSTLTSPGLVAAAATPTEKKTEEKTAGRKKEHASASASSSARGVGKQKEKSSNSHTPSLNASALNASGLSAQNLSDLTTVLGLTGGAADANPFLAAMAGGGGGPGLSGGAGVFGGGGANPFLAGLPGFGGPATSTSSSANLAAMAQLQSLMGMQQGIEALFGGTAQNPFGAAAGVGAPTLESLGLTGLGSAFSSFGGGAAVGGGGAEMATTPPSLVATSTAAATSTTASSSHHHRKTSSKDAKPSTSHSSSKQASTASSRSTSKLTALADKLAAAQKSEGGGGKKQQSSSSRRHSTISDASPAAKETPPPESAKADETSEAPKES